ncbi:hypothetical protein [Noviluteimonas gilva]|uniref:Uncharacterized protein n=1 Tax=Noviluteimonas gilva TaxID=2682097 RepID=A0A7C9I595_9GAMM|nr:hypothetical protein [Lysobacter gilvus]MUV14269.1 hypothetical protein [Lysobacter gilvus]
MRNWGVAAFAAMGVCASGAVHGLAKEVTPQMEYGKTIKDYQSVSAAGDSPFGESINPITGELSFSQADIVLEGTGPAIVLTRTTKTQQQDKSYDSPVFGDWDLSIPRIETMLRDDPKTQKPAGENWRVGIANTQQRCTRFDAPNLAMDEWWHGYDFVTEDGARQLLLKRAVENTAPKPTMRDAAGAPMVFPALTLSHWQIGCLPNTANGEAGEAYLAVSPDGTKYSLDYLVQADTSAVIEDDPDANRIHRKFATMFATRIEDRFGNWVRYHYTGKQLTQITAKDGRSVRLTWGTEYPVVTAITVMPGTASERTWRYSYSFAVMGGTNIITSAKLTGVQLPDNSRWTYAGWVADLDPPSHQQQTNCDIRNGGQLSLSQGDRTATVTAPSGAIGTFVRSAAWRGRSYVSSTCYRDPVTNHSQETNPPLFGAWVLTQRTVSGPGLPTRTWTYAHSQAQSSALRDACAAVGTCAEEAFVDMSDPDGHRTRLVYSTRWGISEGRQLRSEVYQAESTLMRTTTYTYAPHDQGPWPARIGLTRMTQRTAIDKLERLSPVVTTTIVQQGRTFTSSVEAFDVFGRSTRVVRRSAPAP